MEKGLKEFHGSEMGTARVECLGVWTDGGFRHERVSAVRTWI
jgi:hypothetical protein